VLFVKDYPKIVRDRIRSPEWKLRNSSAGFYLFAYMVSIIVGMVGLLSLVSQLFYEQLSICVITGIFTSLAFLPLVVWVSLALSWAFIKFWFYMRYFVHADDTIGNYEWKIRGEGIEPEYLAVTFVAATALFGLSCAFYCDWILAAITGN
jgi:hypothetical protein